MRTVADIDTALGRWTIDELLERYEVLRRVVEYRDGLQHLWNDASANQARAVGQLREWCTRAEASGIRALRDFVAYCKQFDDVWFATREEIAEWYLKNHHTHIA